jgi:hypothetical protein
LTNEERVPANATVSGGNILSMLAAMGPFRKRGEQILSEHGIANVDVEQWYPLRAYVASLRTIGQKMGPNTLLQIGKQIPHHVPLPPGLDTFEKVLASFGIAFDMNHRGVAPNAITYNLHSERSADITTGTPYPCEFDRGVIQGFFQVLLGTRVNVQHGDGGCKNDGAATCTHHVLVPLA